MEIVTPEKILFESKVYVIDDDLRVKTGNVKITESKVMFLGTGSFKLVNIPSIKMIEIRKENRWGFLSAGSIFFITSLVIYAFGIEFGVQTFLSALLYFVLPTLFLLVSLLLIYWWFITRSYLLEMFTDFGRRFKIRSKNKDDLFEIANAVELVKIGAVRELQKRERSFV